MENRIGKEKWDSFDDEKKIKVIEKMNVCIENYVNNKVYRDVQRKQYNSIEEDFRVKFKQEIIAKSILFVKKKKYSAWHISEEGVTVDKIKTTGLEIVRSDTPEIIRPMLKDVMENILKGIDDKSLSTKIEQYKKELMNKPPEAISTNVGVHDLKKYISVENKCQKGTPMHVKGVANYRALLKQLKLDKKYEDIQDESKVKVIYVKKNKFGFDSMAFLRWPIEFDKVIQIDYQRQIEKQFLNKCEMLLEVINKIDILHTKEKSSLGLFFS
jgi:DNA polymerase elongation subunit (family B)